MYINIVVRVDELYGICSKRVPEIYGLYIGATIDKSGHNGVGKRMEWPDDVSELL